MLFTFRDATIQVQTLYGLSNRNSLGMLQAQLTIGSYTFPANRYLLYDCSQTIASSIFSQLLSGVLGHCLQLTTIQGLLNQRVFLQKEIKISYIFCKQLGIQITGKAI